MVVAAFLADLLAPERRTIVTTNSGLRFYVDPLSNLGETLIRDEEYEPDTEQMLRSLLKPGSSFLDVGANEGYFTALAATLVGEKGRVIAVEPQGKLCDVIRINVALNGEKATVVHGAMGGSGECELFLYPSLNTGAASIVRKPRLYRRMEKSPFINPFDLTGGQSFDVVKVDVEGFEGSVIGSLEPLLRAGNVKTLLLDYHGPILAANGVNPSDIEAIVLGSGMSLDGHYSEYQGYRLYHWIN